MKNLAHTDWPRRFLLIAIGVAFCGHANFMSLRAAEPVENWAEFPRPEGASAPTSIAFGNGVFVAVGGNSIIVSTNGADWSLVADPDINGFGAATRVRFVNDRFFAFGSVNGVLMSTDGQEWLSIDTSGVGMAVTPVSDITFGNGAYFGVAYNQIRTSTNAVDWFYLDTEVPFSFITYGNGQFVANGGEVETYYRHSSDAQTWQAAGGGSGFPHRSEVSHQNGSFLGVIYRTFLVPSPIGIDVPVNSYAIQFSENGVDWEYAFRFPDGSVPPSKVVAGGPFYVAPAGNAVYFTTNLVGAPGALATSWIPAPLEIAAPESGSADVAFGNDVFVVLSLGKIFRSNPVSGVAPLRIVKQPLSYSANVGGAATFTALAQGTDPITFQWRFNGTNIVGATNSTLALTNLSVSDAGEYDAIISNPAGNVTTDKAILSVHFADVLLYAGVTLRGSVGDRFLLEYKNSFESPETWYSITNVTLTAPQAVWIDYESTAQSNRFYRATFLGQ